MIVSPKMWEVWYQWMALRPIGAIAEEMRIPTSSVKIYVGRAINNSTRGGPRVCQMHAELRRWVRDYEAAEGRKGIDWTTRRPFRENYLLHVNATHFAAFVQTQEHTRRAWREYQDKDELRYRLQSCGWQMVRIHGGYYWTAPPKWYAEE